MKYTGSYNALQVFPAGNPMEDSASATLPTRPNEKYFEGFPADLFDMLPSKSPMADMVRLTESCESKYQPAFRFGAALAWMATLAGRKIRTTCDLRTNLYLIAVAGTARGKDAALDALNAIDEASKGPDGVGATMSLSFSDGGLLHGLRRCPSSLSVIDELGRVLSGMLSPDADQGNRRLVTAMMRLSTSANRRYMSEQYADPTKNIEVNQPNWSLYGATTPDNFIDGLSSEALKGGMLPRTLPLIGYDNPVHKDRTVAKPSDYLVIMSKAWREFVPAENSSLFDWKDSPKPATWPFEAGAMARVKDMQRIWEEQFRACEEFGILWGLLYTRATEQMKKIALVLAANRHGPCDRGSINAEDVEAAIKLVSHSIENFVRLIGGLIADTSHGRTVARLLDYVRRFGADGVPIHQVRSNFNHVPQYQWDQLVKQLEESEQIYIREVRKPGCKGRPSRRIYSGFNRE